MKLLTAILLLVCQCALGQQWALHAVQTNVAASFRGLSVLDDNVAWVSGSKGTVGRSVDGGQTWTFTQMSNFEKADFRSLYAFDSLHAVVASTGSPAVILRTDDGGQHWNTVYRNEDTTIFIDGIDFWNSKEGMIYGDPIKGHMLLMSTHDGGKTWKMMPAKSRPMLEKGEASFAASNTGIRCIQKNTLVIITGGIESRVFVSDDMGMNWTFLRAPIVKGKSATGMFSIAWRNDTAIVVGGDYTKETYSEDNVYIMYHDRPTWSGVLTPTRGYRECVEFMDQHTLIAAGPTGFDISKDMGMHWQPLNEETGYHVIRKSRKGKLVIAAGGMGRIGVLRKQTQ